ncbi:MAG: hypothetical protein ACTSVL_10200 [Promethearchaeota archaeon]
MKYDYEISKISSEGLMDFVKRAINLLMEGQVSETFILSSYKINTVLKQRFGKDFKVDRIGRALSRLAKQNELKKLKTRVPKYELKKSSFKKFETSPQKK